MLLKPSFERDTLGISTGIFCFLPLEKFNKYYPLKDIWNILERTVHSDELNRADVLHLTDSKYGESQGVTPTESAIIIEKFHLFSSFLPFPHISK